MGVERFDVLLIDVASGATAQREWSKAELLRSVAWLKRMNARGNNIFVKPCGEHGLALLDSLKTQDLASMRKKGFAPAISVEIGSNDFQAWVKLSDGVLPDKVRRLAEAGLASAIGGPDKKGVPDGYGLLAGCANHRMGPNGERSGKYVLAHAGSVEVGKQTSLFVEDVKRALKGVVKTRESKVQVEIRPFPERRFTRGR